MSQQNLVESKLEPRLAAVDEVCAAVGPWVKVVKKGQVFRIVDLEGNQAVDTLFYNAHDAEERYSATDTVRRQNMLYISAGSRLHSNFGDVMVTIIADTCGRH